MNGRTNAKNGAGAIRNGCAVLEVKAPAYSQITAVRADGLTKKQNKGYIDLNNSNYWFYYIIIQKFELSNLIWTVTATNGTETASDTVVISTEGQSESVKLSYNIPAEYQEVKYIESTGTQRISVPLAATKNINALKMVADVTMMGRSSSSTLVGETQSQPYFKFVDFRNTTAIYPTCAANGAVDGTSDLSLLNTRAKLTYEGSGGTINIYKADTLWYSGTRSAKNMNSLSLLATYNGTSYYPISVKLYKFEVYDTDHTTLLHDCYPCYRKSDTVAGLWDKAAETFYTNAGTGTFVVGPDA